MSANVEMLFAKGHEASLDAADTVLARVLTTNNDYHRIAVMLSLESAA